MPREVYNVLLQDGTVHRAELLFTQTDRLPDGSFWVIITMRDVETRKPFRLVRTAMSPKEIATVILEAIGEPA